MNEAHEGRSPETRGIALSLSGFIVLILSMHGRSQHVRKGSAGREIIAAVRAIAGGQRYLSPVIRDALGDEDPRWQ